MRVSIAVVLSVGTLLVCPPSLADKAKDDARVRKVTYDYARCVIKTKSKRAAEAIISNADNSAIEKNYSDLRNDDCLLRVASGVARLKFGGDLYRYALADALVIAEYSEKGESDFSNRLPLVHLRRPSRIELDTALANAKSKSNREKMQKDFDKSVIVSGLSRYGECVVRNDPVRARLWLLTPPDGSEETNRINDLRPSFAACLEGGETLKFSRSVLRGTVAINYFRLAHAAPLPSAEGAH